MALPSIILLASFVFGTAWAIGSASGLITPGLSDSGRSLFAAFTALVTAGAAYLHCTASTCPSRSPHSPARLVMTVVSLALAAIPAARDAWLWVLLLAGLATFIFAMWWDMSDRTRITRRSDVAFWLHLTAAPMIAHPVFNLMGVLGDNVGAGTAIIVLLLYLVFGIVALAVDRRALLVSGLVYVLYALAGLFRQFGAVSLSMALTAFVIGSALLLLSAFWHNARRLVVSQLPEDLAARLPALDRPAPILRPA